MDFLTSIVSAMHLSSALYARFDAQAPWAVSFAAGAERARFGLVTEGSCLMLREGQEPIRLEPGDLFLVLDPSALVLCDVMETPRVSCASLLQSAAPGSHLIRFGGVGARASFITGWFGFDASSSKPLIELLPQLLLFRGGGERDAALRATLDLLVLETSGEEAGGEVVARALADVLFVQAIRAFMASAKGFQHGVFAALADPRLSRAIHAMHGQPQRPWTVASLAAAAGMSRSVFAEEFRRTVGQTPLDYLTAWRIHSAKRLLIETDLSQQAIAERLGYASDGAFAKAFRRESGVTPTAFRREKRR